MTTVNVFERTSPMSGSPFNPYSPPAGDEGDNTQASEGSAPGTLRLATRQSRLFAALIDSLISLALVVPVQWKMGLYRGFPKIQPSSHSQTALWSLASAAVWFAVHGYLLSRSSQTVGKYLMRIRIVNYADGLPAPLWRIALLRYLPAILLGLVPKVGPLAVGIGDLFIFRRDRRCVHDYIAGTVVVRAD